MVDSEDITSGILSSIQSIHQDLQGTQSLSLYRGSPQVIFPKRFVSFARMDCKNQIAWIIC